MLSWEAFYIMMMSPYFWGAEEFMSFSLAYLFVYGRLGSALKSLLKTIAIIILVFVVLVLGGLYLRSRSLHPEAVATVTVAENSDQMGGYLQKLTLEYTYKDEKYVVADVQTSNLLAKTGDKYIVHFSSRSPRQLKFISPDDKAPTPWQIFCRSIKYALIGIIAFIVIVKLVRRRI